jgi:hypothetical protein
MKKKLKKEEPAYNVQKQYEKDMKNSYADMLVNMSKVILKIVADVKQKADT